MLCSDNVLFFFADVSFTCESETDAQSKAEQIKGFISKFFDTTVKLR